jgi:hypothetical protein
MRIDFAATRKFAMNRPGKSDLVSRLGGVMETMAQGKYAPATLLRGETPGFMESF